MNAIIIDDESAARAIIQQLCAQTEDITVLSEFENAVEALKYLNQHDVEVIFLDIHMPGFSGIDFVQTINKNVKVVMTTGNTEFATESYEYDHIVDYLVKPITPERFQRCVQKLKGSALAQKSTPSSKEGQGPQDLYINIDRRLIKLKFNEIMIIEAKGDYIQVKTESKDYTVHTTLKKILAKLPEDNFLQVHRSYIINFNKIIDIEDNSVLIEKNVVPISRSNRPELMRRLNLV
jgi:DNA-binding LytR/AlgR family response regulator